MPKATPVEIPVVNVNDKTVKLTAWLVKDRDQVLQGQDIAEVETSKALIELAAPVSGRIHLRQIPGEELAVGAIVAYIGDAVEEEIPLPPSLAAGASSGQATVLIPETLPSGTRFSKKALALVERHNLSPYLFSKHSMVREQDILEYLKTPSPSISDASHMHHSLKGISLAGLTFPSVLEAADVGTVQPAFLDKLRKDPDSFANLPSNEKCNLYREHGAHIGEEVRFGKGTLVIAPRISIADRVTFGDNSRILLRECFTVGQLSSFREGLSIRGGTAVFGANTFAGSKIQIGGGGNADPWALLIVGDGVYLGDDLFINICRPVLIGREVFLTQRSTVVTHNIGHSVLEGFENAFAPVVLEDFSQVGMNSTLYAGSRIGHSAIVASNSYVISAIPKGKLAMGVPAVVVRDSARPVDRNKQLQIADTMLREFQELLALKAHSVSAVESSPLLHFTVKYQEKRYCIAFSESSDSSFLGLAPADEFVLWAFESHGQSAPSGITRMDLLAKTIAGPSGLFVDSAREFLRKRGIRLEPGPWRYQKGLI